MRLISCFAFVLAGLGSVFSALACPPAQPGEALTWQQQVGFAYDQADTIALAEVVRTDETTGRYGPVERSFLTVIQLYKGEEGGTPVFLEKTMNFPCDQRQFARTGDKALVFARGKVELLRAVSRPGGDRAATTDQEPFAFAMAYVKQRSSTSSR